MINLRHLEIDGCQSLAYMPCRLGELTMLQTLPLFVIGKALVSLPKGLQHVTTLETLSIRECSYFITLPDWISSLTSLSKLEIGGCPRFKLGDRSKIAHIPTEVAKRNMCRLTYDCSCPYNSYWHSIMLCCMKESHSIRFKTAIHNFQYVGLFFQKHVKIGLRFYMFLKLILRSHQKDACSSMVSFTIYFSRTTTYHLSKKQILPNPSNSWSILFSQHVTAPTFGIHVLIRILILYNISSRKGFPTPQFFLIVVSMTCHCLFIWSLDIQFLVMAEICLTCDLKTSRIFCC
ncbi:unnamed protein product, partial [Vitis vinifera]|uniref:Uncharacterized protein n=1 Tax=Vitis vinifera TaxID=29760 RepID=D7T343_VITVI